MTNLASIDIGSHTVRCLVCERSGSPPHLRPLTRKRTYIRLAKGFTQEPKNTIKQGAVERTLRALEELSSMLDSRKVEAVLAVSTGVMREALNGPEILHLIHARTGIEAEIISGNREATLTSKGVLEALKIKSTPFLIFDLGGGSTEFISGVAEVREVDSIPLGAMILTEKFLGADPPEDRQMDDLRRHVDRILAGAFPESFSTSRDAGLIGTGGTVTSLAALVHGIDLEEIGPERMNGLTIDRSRLETLFTKIKSLNTEQRIERLGLDRGRADVIPAGTMVVIRIMAFFNKDTVTVSLSDILEGLQIEYIERE
jgi:exopolyphosphatase/guanosine-5'-triphosphate,3'-diphosphate pyrophosphatase